jgi:DNA-binding NarL/FixJ family response regulator
MRSKNLAVVDEHEIFRRGVLATLKQDPSLEIVHVGSQGPPPDRADVVIASPTTARDVGTGVPLVVCWGAADPPLWLDDRAPVAMLERDRVRSDELLAAVRALSAGLRVTCNGSGTMSADALDGRSIHILRLLSEGFDTRGISHALHYSERTVKGLIRNIEERIGARNRPEAVARAIRLGLI